jgi:hypothetical protein
MKIVNIKLRQEKPLLTMEGEEVLITDLLIFDSEFFRVSVFELKVDKNFTLLRTNLTNCKFI